LQILGEGSLFKCELQCAFIMIGHLYNHVASKRFSNIVCVLLIFSAPVSEEIA